MKSSMSMPWDAIHQSLSQEGYSILPAVLSPDECHRIIDFYDETERYRNVINMQRYRFGKGEYKYFKYPLPGEIESLRNYFYPSLAFLANTWMNMLTISRKFPESHAEFIAQCHDIGQSRPTPLILRYEAGGYNTLHQDLYGEIYFPFQIVCILNQPRKDFEGGEFVLQEQIPRAQSKATVLQPGQGDAVIFTTNFRPVEGVRGYYRAKLKHGISPVKSGIRYALGIIFHDAA
jgi:hypothetical protein